MHISSHGDLASAELKESSLSGDDHEYNVVVL